jgi:hypothetical protein
VLFTDRDNLRFRYPCAVAKRSWWVGKSGGVVPARHPSGYNRNRRGCRTYKESKQAFRQEMKNVEHSTLHALVMDMPKMPAKVVDLGGDRNGC